MHTSWKAKSYKYHMSLKSDWLDSDEEEKDSNVKNKLEEEVEDWDGNLQKQKELKEQ